MRHYRRNAITQAKAEGGPFCYDVFEDKERIADSLALEDARALAVFPHLLAAAEAVLARESDIVKAWLSMGYASDRGLTPDAFTQLRLAVEQAKGL